MPWCPNCKSEYDLGMISCVKCNVNLIETRSDLPNMISFLETEKELQASKFLKFLHFSNVNEAFYEYNKTKELFVVYIDKDSLKQVKKLYHAFYSVESEHMLNTLDENPTHTNSVVDDSKDKEVTQKLEYEDGLFSDAVDELIDDSLITDSEYQSMFDKEEITSIYEGSTKKIEKSSTYVKKEDEYNELRSSAMTFFIVSMVGIFILLLNIFGVLTLLHGILSYTIMGLLLISFFIVGISSLRKSEKVFLQIDDEQKMTSLIYTWLSANVTLTMLNEQLGSKDSEEVKFYQRISLMKDMINEHFGELDDSYLECILEEYYNDNFEVEQGMN